MTNTPLTSSPCLPPSRRLEEGLRFSNCCNTIPRWLRAQDEYNVNRRQSTHATQTFTRWSAAESMSSTCCSAQAGTAGLVVEASAAKVAGRSSNKGEPVTTWNARTPSCHMSYAGVGHRDWQHVTVRSLIATSSRQPPYRVIHQTGRHLRRTVRNGCVLDGGEHVRALNACSADDDTTLQVAQYPAPAECKHCRSRAQRTRYE